MTFWSQYGRSQKGQMAYTRKKRKKWQVLIRKRFVKNIAKTFVLKEDAERYARETEVLSQIISIIKEDYKN